MKPLPLLTVGILVGMQQFMGPNPMAGAMAGKPGFAAEISQVPTMYWACTYNVDGQLVTVTQIVACQPTKVFP